MKNYKKFFKIYQLPLIFVGIMLFFLIIGLIILGTYSAFEGNGFSIIRVFGIRGVMFSNALTLQIGLVILLTIVPVATVISFGWTIAIVLIKK